MAKCRIQSLWERESERGRRGWILKILEVLSIEFWFLVVELELVLK